MTPDLRARVLALLEFLESSGECCPVCRAPTVLPFSTMKPRTEHRYECALDRLIEELKREG